MKPFPSKTSPDAGDGSLLAFVHIGDLHITDAKQRNFMDFLSIVTQIESECTPFIDFVCLPGDNADNGRKAQYKLIATGLKMLSVPVHVITGDHDMEQGSLDNFYSSLKCDRLPYAKTYRGIRCLFLDVCGSGKGGPDFKLGQEQLHWLEQELLAAKDRGESSVIFMHTYPYDLKGDGETSALNQLITAHDVALIDMGHTHYNELANDGSTIFAATRSTGQIEEGPPGYAVVTMDKGVVSWRFKPLDDPFPFVMITSPADHRLLRASHSVVKGKTEVRAMVVGERKMSRVMCRIGEDESEWTAMTRADNNRVWSAHINIPEEKLVTITVQAIDETGRAGQHSIRTATGNYIRPQAKKNGSDADSIGSWPENGIMGNQLGPNRNGKPLA